MEFATPEQLACLVAESGEQARWLDGLDEQSRKTLDGVKHIGEICENVDPKVENKFHNAIVALCDRRNGDLVWGAGKAMEQIYQDHPDVVRESAGVEHKVTIHQTISDTLAAVQARSYFISMVDSDVHLKKFSAIQAVVRIKESDGNYYFRPAILSSTDGSKAYSAEMCFYSPSFYGNSGARNGIVAKDCTEATIYLQSALRHFIPDLVGAKLKQQLVQDCYNVMSEFVTWSRSVIESVAQKQASEMKNQESEAGAVTGKAPLDAEVAAVAAE